MNAMKASILAAALAAASLTLGGTANASPLAGAGKAVSAEQTTNLQQVHYRKYKHRHYRKYRRNRYGYYRGYRRPGVSIYIGPRYGYYGRRHWR